MVRFKMVSKRRRAGTRLAVALGVGALLLSGCSGGSSDAESSGGLKTVTLAMDYLPNAMHGGLAYAMQKGLFETEGIKVKLIAYNGSTGGEPIVAAGKADLAIGQNNSIDINFFGTGVKVRSIYSIAPNSPTHIAVLKSSGITSPAQLAGKVYGGFGSDFESALIDQMIESDGGTGKVKQVVLSTGTYEALKAGKVDTTVTYPDMEYQYKKEGVDIVTFEQTDFGVPVPAMGVSMVLANDAFLTKHPELAKGFVKALQAGYQAAIDDPKAATDAVMKQFADANLNEALTLDTAEIYAASVFPNPNPGEALGAQSPEEIQTAADWMAQRGLLVDPDGKALKEFDVTPFITNDYLPK